MGEHVLADYAGWQSWLDAPATALDLADPAEPPLVHREPVRDAANRHLEQLADHSEGEVGQRCSRWQVY